MKLNHQIRRGRFAAMIGTLVVLASFASTVRADERVTLANGFVQVCNHHVEAGNRVRLYLSAGEDSFIEFAPNEIAAYETIPNAPANVPPSSGTRSTLTAGDLREMLARAGDEHNLDVDLLASVVKAESDGNAHAVSHAGARGLMQLMPSTAAGLGVNDSFEPDQNVRGGSTYLDSLLTRYRGNMAFALAAYNAGPEAVDKYHGIPPFHETRVYVARVIHEFNRRVMAREAKLRNSARNSTSAHTSGSH